MVVPDILTVGLPLTVIGDVGADKHPVDESLNLKVTLPCETAVTKAVVALIVATAVLLLVHVPPLFGLKVVVAPIHNVVSGPRLATGPGVIVIGDDGFEAQLVDDCV